MNVKNEASMTIGQVAKTLDLPVSTLRYYERSGLWAPADRSGSGYRLYDQDSVERLMFIRSAQAVGFTLEDIRELLRIEANRGEACQANVRRLLEQRLGEVSEKMKDLKRVQKALGQALERCWRSNGECNVLRGIRPEKRKRRRDDGRFLHWHWRCLASPRSVR